MNISWWTYTQGEHDESNTTKDLQWSCRFHIIKYGKSCFGTNWGNGVKHIFTYITKLTCWHVISSRTRNMRCLCVIKQLIKTTGMYAMIKIVKNKLWTFILYIIHIWTYIINSKMSIRVSQYNYGVLFYVHFTPCAGKVWHDEFVLIILCLLLLRFNVDINHTMDIICVCII